MATVSGLVCKACGHDQCHHIGYGAFCAASHCECGGYFVAPVAPDPGLREAIAKAEWEAVWAVMVRDYHAEPMTWDEASDQAKDDARAVADAVLAVLAERGVR